MKLLTILLLLFSGNVFAICVNQYVCNDNGCDYIDVCDSLGDKRSIIDSIGANDTPVYGTPEYETYNPNARKCELKIVNGQLVEICR